MIVPTPLNATGALFTAHGQTAVLGPEVWQSVEGTSTQSVHGTDWTAIQLISKDPLLSEIERLGSYDYYYLFRRGAVGRFLLVSSDMKLIHILFERARISGEVKSPKINISGLVNELSHKPGAYGMSAVNARIEGFGDAFKNASFYGSDLAEALLFTQQLPYLEPYRVTLRDVARRVNVLQANSKGEIGFSYAGAASLRDADAALRFITARGYLAWSVDDVDSRGIESGVVR